MAGNSSTWRHKVGRPASPSGQRAEESVATIVLVRGEDLDGNPQWAYALVPADRYMAFKQAEEAGEYDLAEYGEVLHMGPGAEPPEDIRRLMAEEYGCNPAFEEELEAMLMEVMEQLPDIASLFDDVNDDSQKH